MGAGRESYRIKDRWKWGGLTFMEKTRSVCKLLVNVMLHSRYRKLFVIDNFTQPFNKLVGCGLFGHDFMHDYDDPEYFCKKCWKRISEKQHDSMIRRKKLLKIKNRI